MDVFRFHNPTSDTKLEQGEIVNGIKSKMWVERYRNEGEFKFVASADSGVREALPIGSLISHVDTTEVMIVENHEVSDTKGKDADVSITGRGFETIFEQRIVGSNRTFPTITADVEYTLSADEVWNQAVLLIQDHILATHLVDPNDAILYTTVMTDISRIGSLIDRSIPRGDLLTRLLDLLDIEDLGVKVVRPGTWSPLGTSDPNLAIVIHEGLDRTDSVMFSYDTGEIESADYLWSNKKFKNAAYITGRWVETWIGTPDANYDRRVMYIDAQDIDGSFETAPVGSEITDIENAMLQRGIDILLSQSNVALSKVEVSKEVNQTRYRTDFNVGDVVTVHGNYHDTHSMRIIEYVEIEDETGSNGYPTLTMI